MIVSLNVFISCRSNNTELKNKFLESYARLWLWSSDDVIREVGTHLDYQVEHACGDNIEESILKDSFATTAPEMRTKYLL